MKKLFIVLLSVFLFGCATNKTMYRDQFPAKDINSEIEIYNTKPPDKAYIEIGELKSLSAWGGKANMKNIKAMARKIGADAVIITGTVLPLTNEGIKGIAIKYK